MAPCDFSFSRMKKTMKEQHFATIEDTKIIE